LCHHLLEELFAVAPLTRIGREEDVANRVAAAARHVDAEPESLALEEAMGELEQDASAVAGLRIPAGGTAGAEAAQKLEPLFYDLRRFFPSNVRDESDAAGIALGRRVVETPTGGACLHSRSVTRRVSWPTEKSAETRIFRRLSGIHWKHGEVPRSSSA